MLGFFGFGGKAGSFGARRGVDFPSDEDWCHFY
jgi:hypothetical protein